MDDKKILRKILIPIKDLKKIISLLQIQVRATLSQEVIQRGFENGKADLEVQVKGSAKDLADELSLKTFSLFAFEIKGLSSNKLEVDVKKKEK